MHDAVGNKDVGDDDLGGIDEYGAVFNGDGYALAIDGLQSSVGEQG